MSESTVLEWLDENSYRSYPLVLGGSPEFQIKGVTYNVLEMIVDANLVVNTSRTVKLLSISVADHYVTFTITGDITFSINLMNTFPAYVYNGNNLLVVSQNVNKLDGLTATVRFNDLEFEPSVVTVISPSFSGLNSISLNGTDLGVNPEFRDGMQLSVKPNGQTIQIEAGVNEGLPLPCENFRSTTEQLDCNSVVSSIAGAAPVNSGDPVTIKAGKHVKVFDDQDNHRVYIGLDFVSEDIGLNRLLKP